MCLLAEPVLTSVPAASAFRLLTGHHDMHRMAYVGMIAQGMVTYEW